MTRAQFVPLRQGKFGQARAPADLPPDGVFPPDWDGPGRPDADADGNGYTVTLGEQWVYQPDDQTDPLYNTVWTWGATGWVGGGLAPTAPGYVQASTALTLTTAQVAVPGCSLTLTVRPGQQVWCHWTADIQLTAANTAESIASCSLTVDGVIPTGSPIVAFLVQPLATITRGRVTGAQRFLYTPTPGAHTYALVARMNIAGGAYQVMNQHTTLAVIPA